MTKPRYEALVMNGETDSIQQLQLESLSPLGGRYCREEIARMAYNRHQTVARVWDNQKNEGFWLNNVNWN